MENQDSKMDEEKMERILERIRKYYGAPKDPPELSEAKKKEVEDFLKAQGNKKK